MRKALLAVLSGGIILCVHPAVRAQNVVAQAVQKLRLSPQQLLSLRDFLGAFDRNAAVEASGEGLFVLRDSRTMAYAGEFSLGMNPDDSLQIDRVSGPGTLDQAHAVLVPLRLDAKLKARLTAALNGSEILEPPSEPSDSSDSALHASPALPEQWISGANLTEAKAPADIAEARAIFFRDGSGSVLSIRVPATAPASVSAKAAPPPPSLHVSERFFSPIRSDATHAWRDAVFQIDGDVQIGFSGLETRFGCAVGTSCTPRGAKPPASGAHVIRWSHQLLAAVPPSLMAAMSAGQTPPAPSAPQTTEPSTNPPSRPPPPQSDEN